MARASIRNKFTDDNNVYDLPVVCKKLSCPQGSSRKGALIGAGADGCSAYTRCDTAVSKATREKVMIGNLIAISFRDYYVDVFAKQRWLAP